MRYKRLSDYFEIAETSEMSVMIFVNRDCVAITASGRSRA